MKRLVIGTKNQGKVEELNEILSNFQVVGLEDDVRDVIEDTGTLKGNAIKKATTYSRIKNLPTVSDDTGLEVEALNGKPGVKTARFAHPEASIEENKELLLDKLSGVSNRKARWRTIIAFSDENGIKTFEGICEGKIAKTERGSKGFGYDPLFIPKGYNQTFAEISSKEKNSISHRKKALQKFVEWFSNQP